MFAAVSSLVSVDDKANTVSLVSDRFVLMTVRALHQSSEKSTSQSQAWPEWIAPSLDPEHQSAPGGKSRVIDDGI